MQRSARWAAVIGGTAVAGVALLAAASLGGSSNYPQVGAQATGTPATATPTPMITAITAAPTTGQTGTATTFTAVTSTGAAPTGGIYIWVFGDNATTTGNPVTHTYTTPGTYQVVVTASGAATGQATLTYTVIAGLTVSAGGPYTGVVGQAVNMTASGTSLPADVAYSWTFGDNTTGTGATVSHIYTTSGTYTVTLTASSASTGRSGSATTTATISGSSPSPSLSISGPSSVTAGQSATYSVNATGSVPSDVAYSWNFGDGTATAAGSSVNHTFASPGTYTVTVVATSASTPSANTQATTTVSVGSAAVTGPTVTYQTGWNLVSGPAGTTFTQALNPLYTLTATTGGSYATVPNTQGVAAGQGYWAYFNSATTVSLNGASAATASVTAPAGQYIMVGNPSSTKSATVSGADVVYTYSPSGGYVASNTLAPGQGAWAFTYSGGTLTIQ